MFIQIFVLAKKKTIQGGIAGRSPYRSPPLDDQSNPGLEISIIIFLDGGFSRFNFFFFRYRRIEIIRVFSTVRVRCNARIFPFDFYSHVTFRRARVYGRIHTPRGFFISRGYEFLAIKGWPTPTHARAPGLNTFHPINVSRKPICPSFPPSPARRYCGGESSREPRARIHTKYLPSDSRGKCVLCTHKYVCGERESV